MSDRQRDRAQREMTLNSRYKWFGEVSASRVRGVLGRARLFVLSSRMEGGANALGEAIVAGLPVLASRIAGSIGILGEDYPGYFDVGNTTELARLMLRCETDPSFLDELVSRCRDLTPMFDPRREQAAWVRLLDELFARQPDSNAPSDIRRRRC